jgi:hypothetical protein
MNRRWVKGLQSFLAVGVLAVILWTWADQQLTTAADIELTVRVRAKDRAAGPANFAVHLRVEGPQEAVNELRRTAQAGESFFDYQVLADEGAKGSYTVPVLNWLRTHEQLQGRGISVVYCTPRTLDVELDQEYELPVVVVDRDRRPLEDHVAQPSRLKVRMFRSRYETLREREVQAVLERPLAVVDGRPQEGTARLELPSGATSEATVAAVTAAVRGKRRTFENVPITLSVGDVGLWKDYVPEVDPKLLRVKLTVQGPADRIDALKLDDVFAYVVLGKGNAEAEPLDSEIRFRLPEGIETVQSTAAESRSPDPARIKVQLKKRAGMGG